MNLDFSTVDLNTLVSACAALTALLAYLAQVAKPRAKAVARLVGDWPAATVTATNAGNALLSVDRIGFDVHGDGLLVDFPPVEHASANKFPHLLVRGAALKVSFPCRALERIPVNVRTRVVLELSDGSRLVCKGRVLA